MFMIHKTDTGAVVPWEYLAAAAGEYKAGQLLDVSGGQLTAITAVCSTTPAYLCMGDTTAEAGDVIPVTRVTDDVIYENYENELESDTKVGSKMSVGAGGLTLVGVTAGTFEVTYLENADGGVVRGRFIT